MIYTSKINTENFDTFLNNNDISLIYIKASWCGPCKQLSPIVDEIGMETGSEITIAKIDADEEMDFVKSLNVRNIPTLLFYQKGDLKDRSVGLKSKKDIYKIIEGLSNN